MTDEQLIERLRSNIFGTGTTMLAADRIEELLAERKKDHANINLKADFIDKTINQLAEADAKLAKAVELLTLCRDMFGEVASPSDPLSVMLNETLAEIKGESHD